MRTKSYESKYSGFILCGSVFAVGWGFIGLIWGILMFLKQDQPPEIIMLVGITGLFGLCVPAIIEGIDGCLDLTPRFMK